MLEVISTNRKLMLNFSDRMIQEEWARSYKISNRPRKARSDNKEYIMKIMLLDKEKIIEALLLHQDIIYNPVVINKWGIDECPSILKLDLGFMDRHKFITKTYVWSSRRIDWCTINIPMLRELWHPLIDRKDIVDVDLRHYTLAIWLLIQQNNFSRLQ
jgi:hypothetical protein